MLSGKSDFRLTPKRSDKGILMEIEGVLDASVSHCLRIPATKVGELECAPVLRFLLR